MSMLMFNTFRYRADNPIFWIFFILVLFFIFGVTSCSIEIYMKNKELNIERERIRLHAKHVELHRNDHTHYDDKVLHKHD